MVFKEKSLQCLQLNGVSIPKEANILLKSSCCMPLVWIWKAWFQMQQCSELEP
jgi:hypothetical protein